MKKFIMLLATLKNRILLKRKKVRISLLSVTDNNCKFGENIYIDRFCYLHSVDIGDYSYMAYNCSLNNCSIGKFCSIASGVNIGLPLHPIDRVSTSPVFYSKNNCMRVSFYEDEGVVESKKTIIGNDVWIGTNAIIMGGITIGNGAIIAAGSVVTKDVASYAIVGGIPAEVIKIRFGDYEIEALGKIKWWEFNEKQLLNYASYMNSPQTLINMFK